MTPEEKRRASWRKYNATHREENRERTRQYTAAHREDLIFQAKTKANLAAWRESQEGATRVRQYSADYYAKIKSDAVEVMRHKLMNARNRADRDGLLFDEALFVLLFNLPTHCESCAVVLDYASKVKGSTRSRAPSIDRVDNTRGYTIDNVAFLCFRCNALKSDASAEELKNLAKYIERHAARLKEFDRTGG